jgi:hypothetical protein
MKSWDPLRRAALLVFAVGFFLFLGGAGLDLLLLLRVYRATRGDFASVEDVNAAMAGPVSLQMRITAVTMWTTRASFAIMLAGLLLVAVWRRKRALQRAG